MFKSNRPTEDIESPDAGMGEGHETPWAMAARRHEDRTIRLQAQVKNWRLFAFCSLGVAALAVSGLTWIGAKSKFIPMVFEVDKLSQVVAVKALDGDEAVADVNRLIYREMFDLIENLRTVSTDRQVNDERIIKGFSRREGAARDYVRTELRKAPPNEVGATKSVQVVVRSALKLSDKSWQVDWEEQSYNLSGGKMGPPEFWRATVQYKLVPSSDEKIFRRNPSGFQVPDISWQAIAQQGSK